MQDTVHFIGIDGTAAAKLGHGSIGGARDAGVQMVTALVASRRSGDDTIGWRAFLVRDDASISLVQSGTVLWTREEALGHSVHAEFVDIPEAQDEIARMESEFGHVRTSGLWANAVARVSTQSAQLAALLHASWSWLVRDRAVDADGRVRGVAQQQPLARDAFDTERVIVVLSAVGKVFGIHSRTGDLLWTWYNASVLPGRVPGGEGDHDACFGGPCGGLFVLRTAAHPPPVIALLGRTPGEPLPSMLVLLDPLTGRATVQQLPCAVEHAMLLPYTDAENQRILVLVDRLDRVYWYPATPSAESTLRQHASKIYLSRVDAAAHGYLRGCHVEADGDRAGAPLSCYSRWSMQLPPQHRPVALVTHASNERIKSGTCAACSADAAPSRR